MKKYYSVSFQYSESVYCSNIAHAETVEDVENHYKKYSWFKITEATAADVEAAQRKEMPIVEVEHMEETTEKEGENTMTRETAIEAIKTYFEENEEEFNEAIEELDSYNGYLNDDRYYSMYDLDELYHDTDASEILARAFYGYDEMYTDKDGNHTEPFNPNREYFRYNGYGNLVSTDCKDYSDHLDSYFVENYIDNAAQLYNVPDEVQEIIDSIEE